MAPETPTGRELEAETLLWVARLPLLRLEALSALTGASVEETRRAVDALRRHGWVERLLLDPGLGEDGRVPVYALRPVAVSAFSDAFGMDERVVRREWPVLRGDLLDRIAGFETADVLNGVLATIVQGVPRAGCAILDLRALPRRRPRDRWWPGLVEAYGRVLLPSGGTAAFLLALDRADVPDVHRRARVRAWYGVQADDWRRWPATLLVSPSRTREEAWVSSVRRVGWEDVRGTLDVGVATLAEVQQRPLDCWRRLGEGRPVGLLAVLGSAESHRPFALSAERRFDLLDRGVARTTPPMREWATRRLASGDGRRATARRR